MKVISDMDYIRQIAFEDKLVEYKIEPQISRNDVFVIRNHSEMVPRKVILNENKLDSLYN